MSTEDTIPHPKGPGIVKRSKRPEKPEKPEKPGALHGQVWLTIQTRQAQQLIHGRAATPGKPAIIGLVGFADRLRVIWQAARHDDPYADWWLIKVHEAIESNVDYVRSWQSKMCHLLDQMTAMDITVAASSRPYRIPLQFANPYAYQAARLLSEYDALVCRVSTARHVGLLDSETSTGLVKSCARKLRATFLIPQRYRFLKIDRESVHKASGRSHEARQIMGDVPDDILSGERLAPVMPRKVSFPSSFAGVKLRAGSPVSDTVLPEDKNDDS